MFPRGEAISSADVSNLELSVVIPALNEARRLPRTLNRLAEYLGTQALSWEIVVVSNGSTDQTDETVRDIQRDMPELRLISISQRGKGIATKTGALATQGAVVFLCDADLSMPVDQLRRFLDKTSKIDVIVGSREAPGAKRYGEPWHRHLMGRIFNRLVQILAVRGINDTQCGFKAFSRAAANDLFPRQTLSGFGFDVELLFLAHKLNYAVHEMPIDWHFDSDTRVRPGIDSFGMVWEVVLVRWRDLLGKYERAIREKAGETQVG